MNSFHKELIDLGYKPYEIFGISSIKMHPELTKIVKKYKRFQNEDRINDFMVVPSFMAKETESQYFFLEWTFYIKPNLNEII